jgi:hypothetical protein
MRLQLASTPSAKGVTSPSPVTTTLRMQMPPMLCSWRFGVHFAPLITYRAQIYDFRQKWMIQVRAEMP